MSRQIPAVTETTNVVVQIPVADVVVDEAQGQAYREGRHAYRKGLGADACPYVQASQEGMDWDKGFMDAFLDKNDSRQELTADEQQSLEKERKSGESDHDWGRRVGFADILIKHWILRRYSEEFQKGYRQGRDEIEGLCESATQSRCG